MLSGCLSQSWRYLEIFLILSPLIKHCIFYLLKKYFCIG